MAVRLCLLVALVVVVVSRAHGLCNITEIQHLSQQQLVGGWGVADTNSEAVQALKQKAVASNGVDRGFHVSEAYQQVVAGMNYCIRFGAHGKCSGGLCQSFECVASGHMPLSGNEITDTKVDCQQLQSCDINDVSERAKTPMPGGWSSVSDNSMHVGMLHESASQLAAVRKGSVTRAYHQVVAGKNYCIEFKADGLKDCQDTQCTPKTCVASGFLPLPSSGQPTVSPSSIQRIGVVCDGGRLQMSGGLGGDSGSSTVHSVTLLTSLVAILTAILF
jgi:hypothetical protein